MSYVYPDTFKSLFRDRAMSFAAALSLHLAALWGGGAMFVEPVSYVVKAGVGSIEVRFVAPPSAPAPAAALKPPTEIPAPPEAPQARFAEVEEAVVLEAPAEVKTEQAKETNAAPLTAPAGVDDIETAPSSKGESGAEPFTAPDYFRNPAPRYPEASRRNGEEGLVILQVVVSREGGTARVSVVKTSGFALLDDAALRTVRRWRFRPANVGGFPQESVVEVPIRFRLEGP